MHLLITIINEDIHILIDGGTANTYRTYLRERLIQLRNDGKAIDLLVVTHIDNDHIGGIIELLKENGSNENPHIIEIRNIWHNSYRHLQFDKKDALEENGGKLFPAYEAILKAVNDAFCDELKPGEEIKLYELLQIPMSLVTSVFINIFDRYLNIVPDTLGQKLLVLFFAIVVTGIGAATMVNMKLVPNPADALAATIGDKLGKGMGIGKNVFDVTCFCISGIIGLVFTRHIIGLGIGTVLAVIFTGRVIAVYNYFLKHPMQNLAGITAEL